MELIFQNTVWLHEIYCIASPIQNNSKKPKSKHPIKITEEKATSIHWELLDGDDARFPTLIFLKMSLSFFIIFYILCHQLSHSGNDFQMHPSDSGFSYVWVTSNGICFPICYETRTFIVKEIPPLKGSCKNDGGCDGSVGFHFHSKF